MNKNLEDNLSEEELTLIRDLCRSLNVQYNTIFNPDNGIRIYKLLRFLLSPPKKDEWQPK